MAALESVLVPEPLLGNFVHQRPSDAGRSFERPNILPYNSYQSMHLPPKQSILLPENSGITGPTKAFANPTPLGLASFGFNAFLLSILNWHTRDVTSPSIIIGAAFAYGGLVQLLAGMW